MVKYSYLEYLIHIIHQNNWKIQLMKCLFMMVLLWYVRVKMNVLVNYQINVNHGFKKWGLLRYGMSNIGQVLLL